ncbi:hypothetical protein KQX54_019569 [Cotesia glomerata]|uniref:Uncharacterized protein n=1 Tax=Cotesia glomerata TaxID=32391 RepID=A0AAV7J0L7_COTGL|nr:hypothetical protein KQX54_019569 [Cotesia glomerata]
MSRKFATVRRVARWGCGKITELGLCLKERTARGTADRKIESNMTERVSMATKVLMETFQEAGVQMLREFRALLQHSPLPLPGTRLLQLLALNMFAIETTQLKDSGIENGKPQICVADALEKL